MDDPELMRGGERIPAQDGYSNAYRGRYDEAIAKITAMLPAAR